MAGLRRRPGKRHRFVRSPPGGATHALAKRVHTLPPRDVRLTFADGSTVTLSMRSAEFFLESFQAEGVDDAGNAYRLVTDGADDPLVAGREAEDGWTTVGEATAVERAG